MERGGCVYWRQWREREGCVHWEKGGGGVYLEEGVCLCGGKA